MSSTSRGLDLEKRVFSFLDEEIKADRFFAKPECCAIFHRKPYYSRDRVSNIVFDVAIELTLPGADTFSMVCLIECKHYDHPVPVDDIEEFFSKVQQVGAAKSKAIVVTNNAFQRGALEFARAKGVGLLRVFPTSEFKWVLHRSPSSLQMSRALSREAEILSGLTEEHYRSRKFDFFCNLGNLFTYSPQDFFMALASESIETTALSAIAAERDHTDVVPFIGTDEIEQRCQAVHSAIDYDGGAVSLERVCSWQQVEAGLTVLIGVAASREDAQRGSLGRISFGPPPLITVFSDPIGRRRQRFTLAHELGHLFLGHGTYLEAETVDAKDIESGDDNDLAEDDIQRLEWQANYFASSLLLPRDSFVTSAREAALQMDLKDRGYGLIFLDHQPVNTRNYYELTSALMGAYEVSRQAVTIRLISLGLLGGPQQTSRLAARARG